MSWSTRAGDELEASLNVDVSENGGVVVPGDAGRHDVEFPRGRYG